MIGRLARAAEALEARIGAWPVGCTLLLALLVVLGAAMLAGR